MKTPVDCWIFTAWASRTLIFAPFNADGKTPDNHNFAIGGRKQALIWHDNLIRQIHTLDYIHPKVPGTYGDTENNQNVKSFSLNTAQPNTVLCRVGRRNFCFRIDCNGSRFSIRIPLFIVMILGGILIWSMSPTMEHFPVFPACWAEGWVGHSHWDFYNSLETS